MGRLALEAGERPARLPFFSWGQCAGMEVYTLAASCRVWVGIGALHVNRGLTQPRERIYWRLVSGDVAGEPQRPENLDS